MISLSTCFISLLLALVSSAVPTGNTVAPVSGSAAISHTASTVSTPGTATASDSAASPAATVPFISLDPNGVLWNTSDSTQPQAIRGSLGANILGPADFALDRQNADLLAPPTTDYGDVGQAKWPFSLSHNRLQTGGWARQANVDVMPIATDMAGVNMRLEAGAIREMHWHNTAEWAYVLKGNTQVTAVDQNGRNFIGNVGPGDLWYFPPGIPHSLQATDDDPEGSEFLLVFDNGVFSEDNTFMITDWLSHVPVEVLAKNFQTDISAFAHIPAQELYIFPGVPPTSNSTLPTSPNGLIPNPFTFPLSQVPATQYEGGAVKIVDSRTFLAATQIAAAEVTVEPGAMRELHWHPTMAEWTYYLEGSGRVTVFASQDNARTFNYQAGDIGYVPATMGHYVENTGNTTLKFLELFASDLFEDISLSNWLALTPPELVQAHLGFDNATIALLPKNKPEIVGH